MRQFAGTTKYARSRPRSLVTRVGIIRYIKYITSRYVLIKWLSD